MLLAGVLILGRPNLVALPQGLLAVLYLGHVVLAGESTWEGLGLVSLGILLVGELSQWSFDSRVAGRYEAGLHVAWFSLESLGVLVRRHRADDTVTKAITRILRSDLVMVMVDDIGLLAMGTDATVR